MKPKLTYANLVSTLCLFLLLGGGAAFAASGLGKNSVGTKQIKADAVTGAKVKDQTLTGADIKASSLGTVPHASAADSATHATSSDQLAGVGPTGYVRFGQTAGGALSGTYPNPTLAATATIASAESGKTIVIAEPCTHYDQAEVTIDAPSPGTVVVTATVVLNLAHTTAEVDQVNAFIGTSPSDCTFKNGFTTSYSMPAGEPTYTGKEVPIPSSNIFSVSAGSHTYYLNGTKHGTDTEKFWFGALTAVFYPS
jgi:hypothetical protein